MCVRDQLLLSDLSTESQDALPTTACAHAKKVALNETREMEKDVLAAINQALKNPVEPRGVMMAEADVGDANVDRDCCRGA